MEGPAKRSFHDSKPTWYGRTDQNKSILVPVDTATTTTTSDNESNPAALTLEDNAVVSIGAALLESGTVPNVHVPPTQVVVPGDYAVVEVSEAKGHTLRGRLLWKTTLANFAKFDANVLSKMDRDRLTKFKEQLYSYIPE
jgi:hypothetical protein